MQYKYKKGIFAILLLTALNTFSQLHHITVVDATNNERINNVKLLSENGEILGTTDSEGSFNIELKVLKEKKVTAIETSHFLYESNKISPELLPDTIRLTLKANLMEEVIVMKKKRPNTIN